MASQFRDFVPPLGMAPLSYRSSSLAGNNPELSIDIVTDHPKIKDLKNLDYHTYSINTLSQPGPKRLISAWTSNLSEPFFGITTDGIRKEDLFSLADEGAPIEKMVGLSLTAVYVLSSTFHISSN